MADYGWPLQQAVYAALIAASPSIAGGRIYDHVPDRATADAGDYLTIDGGQSLPDDLTAAVGTDSGIESYLDIHVWAQSHRGRKAALELMSRIHDVFQGATLTVTGRASAHAWVDASRGPMLDPDGVTRHGIVTLKIIHRS